MLETGYGGLPMPYIPKTLFAKRRDMRTRLQDLGASKRYKQKTTRALLAGNRRREGHFKHQGLSTVVMEQ